MSRSHGCAHKARVLILCEMDLDIPYPLGLPGLPSVFFQRFPCAIIIDKDRSHIRISLFNMPEKFHQILEDIAMIAFFGFLVWSTWELLPKIFSRYAATGWSIKVGYYAIIFGSSLAILGRLAKYLPKRFSKWF